MAIYLQDVSTVLVTSSGTLREQELPTIVMFKDAEPVYLDIQNNFNYQDPTIDLDDIAVDFDTNYLEFNRFVDALVDLNVDLTDDMAISIIDELHYAITYSNTQDTIVNLLLQLKNIVASDIKVSLFFDSYIKRAQEDIAVFFRVSKGGIAVKTDVKTNVDFSNVKYYNWRSDIYCSTATVPKIICTDLVQASGRMVGVESDIYTTVSDVVYVTTDFYSAGQKLITGMYAEIITASGGFANVRADLYATTSGISSVSVDIKTRSLHIGEFFIEADTFTTVSSVAWVDIIDYIYPVDEVNTYLAIDGVVASGIYFKAIDNGVRMYYDPIDDFYSNDVMVYSVHAESVCGEKDDRDFYLLYGYNIDMAEVADWDANSEVVVRAEARNLVFCPHTESAAFYFETKDLEAINLPCSINAIQYEDLGFKIYPQSKAFFYGKTYTVIIKGVKDYFGNVVPDFEYTFTIENPRRR